MQNGLQLNPDKSEALIIGTAHQLRSATSTMSSVTVADVDLPLANETKVLGVILDWHLTFEKHVSAVAQSCNYHNQAICHIRHLLTTQLAQTLACSLILSRLDYYNAVLHGIPSGRSYSVFRTVRHRSFSRCQATTMPAALEAGSTLNHVQVASTGVSE